MMQLTSHRTYTMAGIILAIVAAFGILWALPVYAASSLGGDQPASATMQLSLVAEGSNTPGENPGNKDAVTPVQPEKQSGHVVAVPTSAKLNQTTGSAAQGIQGAIAPTSPGATTPQTGDVHAMWLFVIAATFAFGVMFLAVARRQKDRQ